MNLYTCSNFFCFQKILSKRDFSMSNTHSRPLAGHHTKCQAEDAKRLVRRSVKNDGNATSQVHGDHIAEEIRARWLAKQVRAEAARAALAENDCAERDASIKAMSRAELEKCLQQAETLIPRLRTELEHVLLARDDALSAVRRIATDLQMERDLRVNVAKLLYSPALPLLFQSASADAHPNTSM